jgi:hypothetical protein
MRVELATVFECAADLVVRTATMSADTVSQVRLGSDGRRRPGRGGAVRSWSCRAAPWRDV